MIENGGINESAQIIILFLKNYIILKTFLVYKYSFVFK